MGGGAEADADEGGGKGRGEKGRRGEGVTVSCFTRIVIFRRTSPCPSLLLVPGEEYDPWPIIGVMFDLALLGQVNTEHLEMGCCSSSLLREGVTREAVRGMFFFSLSLSIVGFSI